jgi:hypothetical protein
VEARAIAAQTSADARAAVADAADLRATQALAAQRAADEQVWTGRPRALLPLCCSHAVGWQAQQLRSQLKAAQADVATALDRLIAVESEALQQRQAREALERAAESHEAAVQDWQRRAAAAAQVCCIAVIQCALVTAADLVPGRHIKRRWTGSPPGWRRHSGAHAPGMGWGASALVAP